MTPRTPVEQGSSAVLSDGEVVLIRRLRPQDADAVLALHEGLDERARYLRFFGAPSGLGRLSARIAGEAGPAHMAVGAFRRDRLIGVAHFEVTAEPAEAEVALAVDGRAQAHGVGTLLLEHLGSMACGLGIRRFTGEVGAVPAGPVGVVSQSGGFGIALVESLRGLGIGLSSLVSTGDKYDVSGNDLLLWWQRDPNTEIAVLYLESSCCSVWSRWWTRRGTRWPLPSPIVMRLGSGSSSSPATTA